MLLKCQRGLSFLHWWGWKSGAPRIILPGLFWARQPQFFNVCVPQHLLQLRRVLRGGLRSRKLLETSCSCFSLWREVEETAVLSLVTHLDLSFLSYSFLPHTRTSEVGLRPWASQTLRNYRQISMCACSHVSERSVCGFNQILKEVSWPSRKLACMALWFSLGGTDRVFWVLGPFFLVFLSTLYSVLYSMFRFL